jgi:DNA-binding IclR family transcriptional regulator
MLRAIAARGDRGLRLVDLVRWSKLSGPTVHRMLKGLVAENLIRKDPRSHCYFLGPLLFELGLAAGPRFDMRQLCEPALLRLAKETGDTVYLIVRSGFDAVCYDRKMGDFPIKALTLEVGNRRPLGIGAGGIALLLSLPDEQIKNIIRWNASQLKYYGNLDVRDIASRVARAKKLGYGLHDQPDNQGATSVAVAIRGPYDFPLAAISISSISDRMLPKRQKTIVALLMKEVSSIEKLLLKERRPPESQARNKLRTVDRIIG